MPVRNASALEIDAPQIRELRRHHIRIILTCPNVICFEHAEPDHVGKLKIQAAAENRADSASATQSRRRQIIPAHQGVAKWVQPPITIFKVRTNRKSGLIGVVRSDSVRKSPSNPRWWVKK